MQKVMIVGCSGSGKSTLSLRLAPLTGLPLVHLDQEYWRPHWVETPKAEWADRVRQLIKRPQWILDGNYGGTMDLRIPAADTIIFLDYPTSTCLLRTVRRIIQYWGKTRPDMTQDCPERFDGPFFHYILNYRRVRRPLVLAKLQKVSKEKEIVILRNDVEVDTYVAAIEEKKRGLHR